MTIATAESRTTAPLAPFGVHGGGRRVVPDAADYDGLVERLHDVARLIDAGDRRAEPMLQDLLAALAAHRDPRCVGLVVFGAGLARRLSGQAVEQANLYLGRFEVPQIHLFNLLGRAVPFVGLATRICNDAIARAMAGQALPTLVDVGIGTGRQFGVLLESLAAQGALPAALHIIGIEPSDWALDEARRHIESTAGRLGVEVSFLGIVGTAESLDAAQWQRIRQACTARPIVNASFALHHIADDDCGYDQRDEVLRRLRSLDPQLLVLAEPDVDHLERRFYRRFLNCFAHFGAVFRTLDRLPLAQGDRDALKVGFFGREIADILGTPEGQRSERHESARQWLQRLRDAGFDAAFEGEPGGSLPGAVHVVRRQQHVSLDAVDEPVVAIVTATPAAAKGVGVAWAAETAVF